MKIYGVALLAACYLTGHILGDYLGKLFHLSGNLGGVGFAMLLLVLLHDQSTRKGWLAPETESGIKFWTSMYIPVVVAMSASQNVKAAISGGWIALLVGILATAACYACIPLLDRMYRKSNPQPNS
jgi:malonate transporter MadL subunit